MIDSSNRKEAPKQGTWKHWLCDDISIHLARIWRKEIHYNHVLLKRRMIDLSDHTRTLTTFNKLMFRRCIIELTNNIGRLSYQPWITKNSGTCSLPGWQTVWELQQASFFHSFAYGSNYNVMIGIILGVIYAKVDVTYVVSHQQIMGLLPTCEQQSVQDLFRSNTLTRRRTRPYNVSRRTHRPASPLKALLESMEVNAKCSNPSKRRSKVN